MHRLSKGKSEKKRQESAVFSSVSDMKLSVPSRKDNGASVEKSSAGKRKSADARLKRQESPERKSLLKNVKPL